MQPDTKLLTKDEFFNAVQTIEDAQSASLEVQKHVDDIIWSADKTDANQDDLAGMAVEAQSALSDINGFLSQLRKQLEVLEEVKGRGGFCGDVDTEDDNEELNEHLLDI